LHFFYTDSDVDTNNVVQTNAIKSYSLIAYGSQSIVDNKTNLYYQLGLSLNKNDSSRYIELIDKTATANYNSYSTFVDIKGTRDYRIDDKLKLTPETGLTLSYFKNKAYTESGAIGMNLSTDKFDSHAFVANIGTSMTYSMNKKVDLLSRASVNYDFVNKVNSVTSSYQGGGDSFATEGLKNSPFGYELGLGCITNIKDELNFEINYDFNGKGKDYKNHALAATFTWNF
jgi:outer membrane autotransporter protein